MDKNFLNIFFEAFALKCFWETPEGVETITYSSKQSFRHDNKATLFFWKKSGKGKIEWKPYRRSRQMVFVYKIDVLEVGKGVKVEGSDRSHWHRRSRRHRRNTWNTKQSIELIEMYPIIQYFSTTSFIPLSLSRKKTEYNSVGK